MHNWIKQDFNITIWQKDAKTSLRRLSNPYMKVYRNNFDKVQKLAGHFGFSPATRKSILTTIDKKENKDDFSDFE